MIIGEKIKKYRLSRNLSQKEVALRTGMSEPAIRNYELGNRTPSDKQIEKITMALNISPYAISNPDLDTYIGVMHALFYLEEKYGLIPDKIDGQVCMRFPKHWGTAAGNLKNWYHEYQTLQNAPENELEKAKASYDEWKSSYPRLSAKRTMKSLRENKTPDK